MVHNNNINKLYINIANKFSNNNYNINKFY